MKPNLNCRPLACFIFTALLFTSTHLFGQGNDVVVMSSGDIKQGKVTAIEDGAVKFKYIGEDLEYTLKTSEISKIQFASGRVQTFSEASVPTASPATATATSAPAPTTTAAERKGKLAVLPFTIISNDPGIEAESTGKHAQSECINSFKHHTHGVVIQDSRTTNSILAKNNIDHNQLEAMSPGEMAVLLGVEFVAYGEVSITNEGTISSGSSYTSYKDKENKTKVDDQRQTKTKGSEFSSGSSSTTINYDSVVGLSIYNDQGNSVYSDQRDAFGIGLESYNNGINYMVKRTPFGDKRK